jgi:hypothetical protein
LGCVLGGFFGGFLFFLGGRFGLSLGDFFGG